MRKDSRIALAPDKLLDHLEYGEGVSIWKKIFGSNELMTIKVRQEMLSQPSNTPNRQQSSKQPSPLKAPERALPAANATSVPRTSPSASPFRTL